MNITLRQIRAFVAVAEHGQFALAASRLNVTPSALSMLIRQLEDQIGARLFDRHTRLVRLTDIGEQFLPVARKTLIDLEAAFDASRDLSTLKRGRVSVATSTVLAATLMPWAIRHFAKAHPGIRVVLRDMAEQAIQDQVRAGGVDLGLGTALDADPELTETLLFQDRLIALLPSAHPLTARREVTWQQLSDEPMIMLHVGSPLRGLVDQALANQRLTVIPAHSVSFSSTVISLVANGLGVAALPVNARQVTPAVDVQVRPLVRPAVARRVVTFRRQLTELSPAAAAFHQSLLSFIRTDAAPKSW